MTTFGKFLLFLTSWWPAYLMIGLITLDEHCIISLVAFAIAIGSIPIYMAMERAIFSRARRSLTIRSIARRDENILLYVLAYLPPFFSVDFSKSGHIFALALFYIIFAITYVKLDLYYLNPMFIFRSYRTYNIVSNSREEFIALIRDALRPQPGETVHYRGRDQVLLIIPE